MKAHAWLRSSIAVAAMATALGTTVASNSAAYAGGKAALGCSPPYQLATITTIYNFSQPLVTAGYFTEDSLLALLNSLDHNGDGYLCYKVPPGWTPGSPKAGFVNLVDDKVLSS
jgi:hypothetical protein